MPAVILAGGLATRMRPLTERIPKALLEIEGHPFLWHQLRLLQQNGIRRVLLLVGYLGETVEEQFGDGSALDIKIQYSYDGPTLMGTAGAIRKALPLLSGPFFVLYGDSYLPCDYRLVEESFRRSGLPGLMTVYRNEGLYDLSNVEYTSGRILKYDKRQRTPEMHHIDYGLGAFAPTVFEALPANQPCDLESVYQGLLASGGLASFEVHERFYEIGSPEGLRDTTKYLQGRGRNPLELR
jgi:MurNAc alpha-1-phosphate uridylyltransferase